MTSEGDGFAGSYAVLIGVSSYTHAGLPAVPAALNSLHAMYDVLTDPALGGWPRERVTVIADPASATEVGMRLANVAEKATGVLLVYYVGHGKLAEQGDLCLTVTATRPDGLALRLTGLPWEYVAEALRTCPARLRLAIVDCCFAGQINGIPLSGDTASQLADLTHVQGVYTLTATVPNAEAATPPLHEQATAPTSFTGELCDVIREGMPHKAEWLTLGDIYPVLRQRLIGKGLPRPGQRGTDTAYRYPLARNVAFPAGQLHHPSTHRETVVNVLASRQLLFALGKALARAVGSALVAAGFRAKARTLQEDLVQERESKGTFSRVAGRVGDAAHNGGRALLGAGAEKTAEHLAKDRDRALDRARALAEEVARHLARANELDHDSDEALAHAGAQAAELAEALTAPALSNLALQASRILADTRLRSVSASLEAVQMDVSGLDLSELAGIDAGNLGVLSGTIWTDDTIWPAGLRDPIRERSHVVRPGMYQIHRVQDDPEPVSSLDITDPH